MKKSPRRFLEKVAQFTAFCLEEGPQFSSVLRKMRCTCESGLILETTIDRGAWHATVHGDTRIGHNLVTKPHVPGPVTERKLQTLVYLKKSHPETPGCMFDLIWVVTI